MAGNYPDVPGHRFVLDKDGSQLYTLSPANAVVQRSVGDIAILQNEDNDSPSWASNSGYQSLLVYFSEPRDLVGIYLAGYSETGSLLCKLESSVNSTNGLDGAWTTVVASWAPNVTAVVSPGYRTGIVSAVASGVRMLRVTRIAGANNQTWNMLHLYGSIPNTSNPNRVAFWHPTLDEPVGGAYFDWGDSPRSSSADRTFRVKNLSSTLTANSVVLSTDALTDGSPSIASMHLISQDGVSFAATQNIGALAAEAISPVQTLRRVLPSNAPLGLWAPRLHATAGSWT